MGKVNGYMMYPFICKLKSGIVLVSRVPSLELVLVHSVVIFRRATATFFPKFVFNQASKESTW